MAFRYADRAAVLAALKLDEGNANHATAISRVEQVENGVAATLDHKTGRAFGVAPVAEQREIRGAATTRLVLPHGVTSVTAVEEGGTWDGTTWADADTVASDAYTLALVDTDGIAWALDRTDGYGWLPSVRVTALWGDQGAETVPDDIREAATFLTVDEYRIRTSSPAREIGPEGLLVPTRNAWKYEMVQTAIAAHRVVRLLV